MRVITDQPLNAETPAEYLWEARKKGVFTLMARTFDADGRKQLLQAEINALGYGNNGVREHTVQVTIG